MPGQAQAQAQARDILRRCCDDVWGLFFIAVPAECRFSDVMRPPPFPALTPFDASAQHLLPTRKYLCLNNFVIKQAEEQ